MKTIEKKGVNNVTADDLIQEVMPFAKDRVNKDVKEAVILLIRESFMNGINE